MNYILLLSIICECIALIYAGGCRHHPGVKYLGPFSRLCKYHNGCNEFIKLGLNLKHINYTIDEINAVTVQIEKSIFTMFNECDIFNLDLYIYNIGLGLYTNNNLGITLIDMNDDTFEMLPDFNTQYIISEYRKLRKYNDGYIYIIMNIFSLNVKLTHIHILTIIICICLIGVAITCSIRFNLCKCCYRYR